MKESSKTPPGFIRKDPPMTPPGYKRISSGLNFGKIRPDSNPPTPDGFMKAQPRHFTFDKDAKPTTVSNGQSQMTPRTMVSTVVEQLGAKLDNLRTRTPEKDAGFQERRPENDRRRET